MLFALDCSFALYFLLHHVVIGDLHMYKSTEYAPECGEYVSDIIKWMSLLLAWK